jgi:hypothetical protein
MAGASCAKVIEVLNSDTAKAAVTFTKARVSLFMAVYVNEVS